MIKTGEDIKNKDIINKIDDYLNEYQNVNYITPLFDIFNTQQYFRISNKRQTLTSINGIWKSSICESVNINNGINYWSYEITNYLDTKYIQLGICNDKFDINNHINLTQLHINDTFSIYLNNNNIYGHGKNSHIALNIISNDRIGFCFEAPNDKKYGTLSLFHNEEFICVMFKNIPKNNWKPCVSICDKDTSINCVSFN